MIELTKEEIQHITGQLLFAKEDHRLLFTDKDDQILDKLVSIVRENLINDDQNHVE